MCSWFSGMMFGSFVVFFRCLCFLSYRFSSGFFVFLSGLSFLGGSRFSFCFFVLFSGLRFLGGSGFSGCFFVLFRSLRFLLSSRFRSGGMVFLVVGRFSGGAVSCSSRRRSRGGGSIGSESNRRQTHCSGNDQS
ncbi:Uncharacterised protein [Klebsiella michiganensis]|uniref:Uncharacterized protein n=1 Tax=Klebsiella michiganensis TaxID=1134687 RepID=A0A7H4MY93_9ENTR|nr:Uncharacterised protein [Klebsiella michiganensis]STT08056.1 Uncharacterised protein [Klebsiella michiganensis]